jgi:hypothetical protein
MVRREAQVIRYQASGVRIKRRYQLCGAVSNIALRRCRRDLER